MIAEYVWVLWDAVAVAILLYFVGRCAARGLLRSIVGLVGTAAAALAAGWLSPILSKKLYDEVVKDAIRVVLVRRLEGVAAEGGEAAAGVLDAVPSGLRRLINPELYQAAEIDLGAEISQMAESLIDAVLMEPVLSILQGVLFLLLFTLLTMVVRYVAQVFTGVYRIPVLGTLNTLLGGLLGVVQAALVLLVSALILQLVILISGGGGFWLNERVIDDSYIWRVFYHMLG